MSLTSTEVVACFITRIDAKEYRRRQRELRDLKRAGLPAPCVRVEDASIRAWAFERMNNSRGTILVPGPIRR